MFGSIAVLFVLPWLDTSKVRSARYRPVYKYVFWIFVAVCIGLGYIGMKPAEGAFIVAGRILTVAYFGFFLVAMPLLGWFERPKPLPSSISEPVLKEES